MSNENKGNRIELRPKRRYKKLKAVAVMVGMLYLTICLIMFSFQDHLIFPGHGMQAAADAKKVDVPNTEFVQLSTTDGIPLVGRFCPVAIGSDRAPTVLYFYGNGSCAAWAIDEVELLRGLGCNVFVPDYAGYGMSGGFPSEKNFYASATAAWDYLQQRPSIDHGKIVVMGWSIGGAVAIDLVSRRPAAGLITLAAFTRLPDVAAYQFPWLPVRLLLRSKFDNLSKIDSIRCPVLIAHGERDTLIPPAMADVLAARLGKQAEQIVLRGAGHNDVFMADAPRLQRSIRRYLDRLFGT